MMGRQMLVAAGMIFLATGLAGAAEKSFSKPEQGANRLDYCFTFRKGCGAKAANAYCVSQGYEAAAGYKAAKGIGATSSTRTIGDNSVCDDAGCDGFSSITCTKASADLINIDPRIDGDRLDWCYGWGTGCGEPAATAWCKTKGFSKAFKFSKDPKAGPTRVISTGQLCDDPTCDSFKSISCSQ